MAASYFKREMNAPAIFELFVRHLPAQRDWLLVAGRWAAGRQALAGQGHRSRP